MKELFYINDKDCWTQWNFILTKGALGILAEPPKRKAQLEHSWPDENGTERDVSTNYFESKEMKIPCAIIADSLADFKSSFDSLMTEIRGTGYFNFDSTGLDRRYSLLYSECSDIDFVDVGVGTFTLTLIDDTPTSTTASGN